MFSAASTDKSYASRSKRATAAQRECLKVNATGKNVTVLTFSSSGLEISTIWRKHVCETFDVIIEIAGVKHDSQTKVALLCTSSRLQNSFASTNYNESTEWKTNLSSSLEAKPKRDLFITIFFLPRLLLAKQHGTCNVYSKMWNRNHLLYSLRLSNENLQAETFFCSKASCFMLIEMQILPFCSRGLWMESCFLDQHSEYSKRCSLRKLLHN